MSGFLKALIVLLGVAIGVSLVTIPYVEEVGKVQKKAEVKINNQYITADIAKDETTRDKGLGGRSSLGVNEGMLFLFPQAGQYGFWMKDMLIPIDLIWIYQGKIVGFEQNMQPPVPGTPDNALQQYLPPSPVDEVLELHAGRVSLLQAAVGDQVFIKPLIPTSQVLQNPQ